MERIEASTAEIRTEMSPPQGGSNIATGTRHQIQMSIANFEEQVYITKLDLLERAKFGNSITLRDRKRVTRPIIVGYTPKPVL